MNETNKTNNTDTNTIDPGEGYRLLAEDEIIKECDQYWSVDDRFWISTSDYGRNRTPKQNKLVYRRKIEVQKPLITAIINNVRVVLNVKIDFTQDVIINNNCTWSSQDKIVQFSSKCRDTNETVKEIRAVGFIGRIILPSV